MSFLGLWVQILLNHLNSIIIINDNYPFVSRLRFMYLGCRVRYSVERRDRYLTWSSEPMKGLFICRRIGFRSFCTLYIPGTPDAGFLCVCSTTHVTKRDIRNQTNYMQCTQSPWNRRNYISPQENLWLTMFEKKELVCSLCYSKYGTGFPQRIPRNLHCKHTFCTGKFVYSFKLAFTRVRLIFFSPVEKTFFVNLDKNILPT